MKILISAVMILGGVILFGANQPLQASPDSQQIQKVVATFRAGHQEWRGGKYGPAASQTLLKECFVVAGQVMCD